jgi:cytochrome oxidase Cu insertion factor (SCO1/SenC/PrrC family)
MHAGAGTKWASRPATARSARIGGALLAAAVVGLGVGFGVHRLAGGSAATRATVTTRFGMYGPAAWAEGARPAPPITTLRDQTGRLFSLSSLRGRTVAMAFFDSHCNQACPLEGRALAAAERALPAAQRPVLVIVSVNPRDTPASERAAARKWGLAAAGSWHWLSGAHAQLARVWKAYRIFVQPTKSDIVHTEALYLIDRGGYERSAYLYPFIPGSVSHDLTSLAGSGRGRA